jgi:hypothetical protein
MSAPLRGKNGIRTKIHELGHAAAAIKIGLKVGCIRLGSPVSHCEIDGDSTCDFMSDAADYAYKRQRAVKLIAVNEAGGCAERMAVGEGFASDGDDGETEYEFENLFDGYEELDTEDEREAVVREAEELADSILTPMFGLLCCADEEEQERLVEGIRNALGVEFVEAQKAGA